MDHQMIDLIAHFVKTVVFSLVAGMLGYKWGYDKCRKKVKKIIEKHEGKI